MEEFVNRANEALNEPGQLSKFIADDIVFTQWGWRGKELVGRDQVIRRYFEPLRRSFEDITFTVLDEIYGADKLVLRGEFAATFARDWGSLKAHGRRVNYYTHDIYEFRDGKIVHAWFANDTLRAARQLGALPDDGKVVGFDSVAKSEPPNVGPLFRGARPKRSQRAAMEAYVRVYNHALRHPVEFGDLFADDVVFTHWRWRGAEVIGRDQVIKKHFEPLLASFDDFGLKILDAVYGKDKLAIRGEFNGTLVRDWGTVAAHGRRVEYYVHDIYEFRDGKVVHAWEASDSLDAARQLGIVADDGRVIGFDPVSETH